jgi:predicted amidophosphoribosyltransferase
MARLSQIDVATARRLLPGDECYYSGEYQSHGGYQAGETNQLISNLKIEVPTPSHRVRWKEKAIHACAELLYEEINHEAARTSVTFVPVPSSKPIGHASYDDRMVRVLTRFAWRVGGAIDVRQAVLTTKEREAQHTGARATVSELLATLAVNPSTTQVPFRPVVIVLDDVFTLGTTFRAMKTLLNGLPGVEKVIGVSIARTVWPGPDLSMFEVLD